MWFGLLIVAAIAVFASVLVPQFYDVKDIVSGKRCLVTGASLGNI
jgi:hypothetical protein